jgi:DNA-binding CsgD family transcriptional regulator
MVFTPKSPLVRTQYRPPPPHRHPRTTSGTGGRGGDHLRRRPVRGRRAECRSRRLPGQVDPAPRPDRARGCSGVRPHGPLTGRHRAAARRPGRGSDRTGRGRSRDPGPGRETSVLACLGTGLTNAQIAASLHLSEATVRSYVSRMLTKLGCADRTQAGLLAQQAGLPTRPAPGIRGPN